MSRTAKGKSTEEVASKAIDECFIDFNDFASEAEQLNALVRHSFCRMVATRIGLRHEEQSSGSCIIPRVRTFAHNFERRKKWSTIEIDTPTIGVTRAHYSLFYSRPVCLTEFK